VLRLISIQPVGLYSYGMTDVIPLDGQGLIHLGGKNLDKGGNSNGAGKSSVPDAITQLMYEEDSKGLRKDQVVNAVWKNGCCARAVFQAPDGKLWRVTYSRGWKSENPYPVDSEVAQQGYRGTGIYLEEFDGHAWVDRRREGTTETGKFIEQLVGMSFSRFSATSLLTYTKGHAFVSGSPADRTRVVTDILDLGIWDRRKELVKAKAKAKESEIESKEGEIRGLKSAIDSIVVLTSEQLDTLVQERQEKEGLCSRTRELVVQHQRRVLELGEREGELGQQLRELLVTTPKAFDQSRIRDLERKLPLDVAEANRRTQLEFSARLAMASMDVQKGEASIQRLDQLLKKPRPTGPICEYCGSTVTQDLEVYRQQLFDEHVKAQAELQPLVDAEASLRREQTTACSEAVEAVKAEYRRQLGLFEQEKQQCESTYREHSLKVQQVQGEIGKLEASRNEIKKAMESLELDIQDDLQRIAEIDRQLTGNDSRLEEVNKLKSKVDHLINEVAQVRGELAYDNWMIKHFGDKGIKSFKFAMISSKLNRYLQEYMSVLDGSMTVWVTPFRLRKEAERKAKPGIEDYVHDLEVWVKDGEKEGIPVKAYSGAERGLIVLAVAAALNRIAEEEGTGTNLLILDEIEYSFSNYNFERVVDFIKSLPTEGKTVIVIGHSDRLLNLLDFDHYWIAEKENGVSRLVLDEATRTEAAT